MMNNIRLRFHLIFTGMFIMSFNCLFGQTNIFDYKRYLFGTPSPLSLFVQSVNSTTGSVTINDIDSRSHRNDASLKQNEP